MDVNTQTSLRLKTPLLPLLFSIVLVMQLIDPGRVWSMLLVGLGIVWIGSYVWVNQLAKKLSLRREMRFGWVQVGDSLEERFTITNRSWIPSPWLKICDHSNLPGYFVSQVRGVNSFSSTSWRTRGTCSRRGVYSLGPTSLHTSDPLGIYDLKLHDPASATLIVMPPIVPLPVIEIAPGGRTGEAPPRRHVMEITVSASTVREYCPEDSLHLIHWKTTARRDDFYVRMFDSTPASDWWIFLDLDRSVQAGQGWDTTDEHAIILAASIADRGLRARRAVGLGANSDPLVWLPAKEGNNQRWDILRALATINRGECSLKEFLFRMGSGINRQSSLLVITPNPQRDWIEGLIPLQRRGASLTVLLLDTLTWLDLAAGDPQRNYEQRRTEANQALSTLTGLGVQCYSIPRSLLDTPEVRPGQGGKWEWRTTPLGRAVAVQQPGDFSWKKLG
jgi:uncharacterized protein (DUF58 family)